MMWKERFIQGIYLEEIDGTLGDIKIAISELGILIFKVSDFGKE